MLKGRNETSHSHLPAHNYQAVSLATSNDPCRMIWAAKRPSHDSEIRLLALAGKFLCDNISRNNTVEKNKIYDCELFHCRVRLIHVNIYLYIYIYIYIYAYIYIFSKCTYLYAYFYENKWKPADKPWLPITDIKVFWYWNKNIKCSVSWPSCFD